jgi:predicted nucleic acid-binding protein
MFWDSSALVPLLIAEARSAQMLVLLAADREPAIWWASPIECQSALRRRQRERTLASVAVKQALQRLRQLTEDLDVVAPTDPVRDAAARSLAAHPLRAADALQLGAALVWCAGESGQGFVCLDDRLREAATREGFEVLPQD